MYIYVAYSVLADTYVHAYDIFNIHICIQVYVYYEYMYIYMYLHPGTTIGFLCVSGLAWKALGVNHNTPPPVLPEVMEYLP